MKRIITLFTFCLISVSSFAQIPQALTYQAIARNAAGSAITSTNIAIRVSIKDLTATGTTVYSETFTPTTNQFGLFTLAIGTGSTSGNFSTINWATGAKFMKVEMDPAGGASYIDMGTSQMLSVPYALVAGSVIGGGGGDDWGTQTVVSNPALNGSGTTGSPLDIAQQGATNGQVLKWNGSTWAPSNDIGGGTGDNWGTQSVITNSTLSGSGITGNVLGLSQQGAVNGQVLKWNGASWAPATDVDNDAQQLSINGSNLTISNGNTVALPTGGSQTLSFSNNTLTISGGNSVNLYNAGTGIGISGSTITNTAPDQIVSLTGTGSTTVTGTYPNFTINSTGGGGSYTPGTGIGIVGNVISNTSPDQTVIINSGSGINVTGTYPNFTIAATGGGGGIGGSGTANYIPKFTPNGTTLGNSQLRDDGTNLAINAAPDATNKLLLVPGASTTGGLKVNYTNASNGTYGINVTSLTGNSYIGYTGIITFGTLTGTNPEIYGASSSGVSAGIFGATSGTNLSAAIVGLSNNWHGGYFATSDNAGGVGILANNTGAGGPRAQGILGIYSGTVDTSMGIHGYNNHNGGITSVGNYGIYGNYNGASYGVGVVGLGFGGGSPIDAVDYGVWGSATFPGYAVYADGDLTCTGAKNASVGTSKGNQLMYSIESPEVWFEDFGTATLVNGEVTINLDPLYLETVFIDATHPMVVTVTPQGDCKGMYVVPGTTSFTVKELNSGTSGTSFSYRITCKRLNYQDHKFGSDLTWGSGDTRTNYQYVQPKPIDYNAMKQMSIEYKQSHQNDAESKKMQEKISLVKPH